ncbi:sugar phosphate isomerase/epimerase [Dysgonomonas sp. ZJ709]|uniref:sugar phosphate isomerase/epimerase family protein n=1 Tax=Dysgonomonas sp. ZJ709 TaxID=2709797 RepID=UPI0013EA3779|nr:sugar phosphate isomerase/epimerase [Dysgonomonas sp. ZJ709]
MKYFKIIILLLFAVSIVACQHQKKDLESIPPKWKLGIQTYSFHKFPLMEALDKTQQLGLHYSEAYFFQSLGKNFVDTAYLNFDIDETTKKQLKEEFAKRDITLYSFGVAFYETTEEWERFFAFSKDMGIHTVTCEPKLEHLNFVEQLALKYKIEVAIHNHPAPSLYADPNVLFEALKGRDPIMGVCADIGHWKRTGNDPVKTLERFAGRIKVVHLKDLNEQLEDTTWGTGILPVKEVLGELKKQNFDGLISVEYENFGDSQLDDILKSLEFYNQNF